MSLEKIIKENDTIYDFIEKLKLNDKENKIIDITEEIKNLKMSGFKKGECNIIYAGKIIINYYDNDYIFILINTFINNKYNSSIKYNSGFILLENIKDSIIKKYDINSHDCCIFLHDIFNENNKTIEPEISFIGYDDMCDLPSNIKCKGLNSIFSLIGNLLLYNKIYSFNGYLTLYDISHIIIISHKTFNLWQYKRLINDYIDINKDLILKEKINDLKKDIKLNDIQLNYLYNYNTYSTYSKYGFYFKNVFDAIIYNYCIKKIKDNIDKSFIQKFSKLNEKNIDEYLFYNKKFDEIKINKEELQTLIYPYEENSILSSKEFKFKDEILIFDILDYINHSFMAIVSDLFIVPGCYKLFQSGGYYNKYLKYKFKYLNLKNKK